MPGCVILETTLVEVFSNCEICRHSHFSCLTIVSAVDVQGFHKMEISTLIGQ
jgi:hypothetical protein